MKKLLTVLTAGVLLAALMLAGCSSAAPASSTAVDMPAPASAPPGRSDATGEEPVTMLVAAAASLEHSMAEELIPLFRERYPWITVEGNYASSGNLQMQIEEGLAADVFFSAATKQMNALVDEELIDKGSVVDLLENEVVLITAADSTTAVTSFENITDAASIAIGDPESVPAGQYAQEVLTSLGVYDQVAATASLGTDVTQVLNWVAEGSAEVGILYATDAATTDKVKVLATAPEGTLATKVVYPVGITAAAPQPEAARLFVEFLQTPEALAIFEKYGFKTDF